MSFPSTLQQTPAATHGSPRKPEARSAACQPAVSPIGNWQISAAAISFSLLLLIAPSAWCAAEPVLRLVRSGVTGTNLLRNADFELGTEGKAEAWAAAPDGVELPTDQGRRASRGLRCTNPDQRRWTGASQSVTLDQKRPAPVVISGWSKAENVSGSMDNNYSLYVDLTYQDGTPLWGQTARFRTGTHDWERREVIIMPEKPIRSLTVHCLFRNHTGTAWFDDVSVTQPAAGEAVMFEGLPVLGGVPAQPTQIQRILTTTDKLSISVGGGQISEVTLDGSRVGSKWEFSGFLARDVATGSEIFGFDSGKCEPLSLALDAQWRQHGDHLSVEGAITDVKRADRAVTLTFNLPVEAAGWTWGDDIRRSRAVEGATDFCNPVVVGCGANGLMALYPMACVSRESLGLALAADVGFPAQYRLGYNAGTRQLYISYDFGLVQETPNPGKAKFRFVIYRFDGGQGFRGAFEKYTRLFPEHFRVRSREQGIWMPFTDVSTVQSWEDFGFRYHEGNNSVPWDDRHGILSFRYTEPMTWWMAMDKGVPRTNPEALRIRGEMLRGNNARQRGMALACEAGAMWDDSGQPHLMFRDTPWCDGAIWSLNPNPQLPAATNGFNAATLHWNEAIKKELYGLGRQGDLDGEYLDSLEGYVTADLNFRREHFKHTTVPLTFDKDTRRPALFKGLAVYEFTRWLSEDVHAMGKLMFANGVPYRFTFLCPWLDVLGTETDWLRNGKYSPASDKTMSLWRTMSGKKPYVLLMNTDYDALTPDLVERYFQRCLFYGMFPGMFSHNASENPYWRNPKWYNRDRALFKKYIPLAKRIAEAGWEPVTHAACANGNIWVERFGPDENGTAYFTLYNDTQETREGELSLDHRALGKASGRVMDLLTGEELAEPLKVAIPPGTVKLFSVQ